MKNLITIFIFLIFSILLHAQDTNISNGVFFDGEPYIAINPSNSQHFVVAWMSVELFQGVVIRTKVSFDAGSTWSDAQYFDHQVEGYGSADVSLAFDSDGNVYAAYVDYDNILASGGSIVVRKSEDGGTTWNEAVEAISLDDCPDKLCIDRPWIAIDTSDGPNSGSVYVTSMNATFYPVILPYNPYFVVSTDAGLSFSDPETIDGEGFYAGDLITQPMPSPALGPDGIFHALYPSFNIDQSFFAQYILASSDNLGSDFEYSIAAQLGASTSDTLPKKGGLLISDPSDPDHLAFFYTHDALGDLDIYMIETQNESNFWTDPLRINDDPVNNGIMQDLVWADFDIDGDLAVCWRDRRSSSLSGYQVPSEIWGTVLWKDSVDFSPNFLVSSDQADHDVILNGSGNDFMCIELVDDTLNAVWGDVRTGTLSIWLNRISLSDGINNISEISHLDYNLEIYPNPTTDFIKVKNLIPNTSFTIYNSKGKLVLSGFYQDRIDIKKLPIGVYFLLVNNDQRVLKGVFEKQ